MLNTENEQGLVAVYQIVECRIRILFCISNHESLGASCLIALMLLCRKVENRAMAILGGTGSLFSDFCNWDMFSYLIYVLHQSPVHRSATFEAFLENGQPELECHMLHFGLCKKSDADVIVDALETADKVSRVVDHIGGGDPASAYGTMLMMQAGRFVVFLLVG